MSQTGIEAETPAAGESAEPIMSHRQVMLVVAGLMAAMFLSSLGQTVFGTAIRTIGDDLHGLDQQAWVTTAFLITSTVSVPIYGKLSDMFGRRPLFLLGIVIFLLGSLLSACATSMVMLAVFRAVQGIGAGALMSLPLAIMGDILAPRERARYQGYFFAVFGLSTVIGPLIGGLFAGAEEILWIDGWRWVLLINLPVGAVVLVMVGMFLHIPRFAPDRAPRIDWWGATAVFLAVVPLLLVAEQGRVWGWSAPPSLACYGIAVVAIIAFIVIERAMGDDAILPLALFRSAPFSVATLLGVLVGFGMFGAMMTLPLFLQIVLGLDPTQAGLAMVPLVVGLTVAAIVSGQITGRTGRYGVFPVLGTATTATGFLMLTAESPQIPFWYLVTAMLVVGLGLGQLLQTLTLASQNAVSPRDMGVATSTATFFRQLGGTFGVAIMLSVLFGTLPANIVGQVSDDETLAAALGAALDPDVAERPENAAIMREIWEPIVAPLRSAVTDELAATAPGDAGAVDWRDDADREYWVGRLLPEVQAQLAAAEQDLEGLTGAAMTDTTFLTGAHPALTRPFLAGFAASTATISWLAFAVMLVAFVLSLFFRVPPLQTMSALQARARDAGDRS